MKPQPRPALKRAEDADLHPALGVAPTQLPTQLGRDTPGTPDASSRDTKRAGKAAAGGKSKGKKPKRAGEERKFLSAGRATSDVLRAPGDKDDKPVKLAVKVPKRVRKEIHAIAKHSGSSVDAIVSQALSEWLGDPRRW